LVLFAVVVNEFLLLFQQVCASMNLAEELKPPKLTAETTWNLEL